MTPAAVRSAFAGRSGEIRQFAGYVAVSGCALCVDVISYWSLLAVTRLAFVAAVGGYLCGVCLHYLLSSRLVFRERFDRRGLADEAPVVAKFFVAGASGLVVTAGIVGLLADVGGFHPLVAKLVASGCSFVAVFISLRIFVFNRPESDPSGGRSKGSDHVYRQLRFEEHGAEGGNGRAAANCLFSGSPVHGS